MRWTQWEGSGVHSECGPEGFCYYGESKGAPLLTLSQRVFESLDFKKPQVWLWQKQWRSLEPNSHFLCNTDRASAGLKGHKAAEPPRPPPGLLGCLPSSVRRPRCRPHLRRCGLLHILNNEQLLSCPWCTKLPDVESTQNHTVFYCISVRKAPRCQT